MKRLILSLVLAGTWVFASYGQEQTRSVRQAAPGVQVPQQGGELPKFDLDFQMGKPRDLVEAIRGKIGTLNAIIPTEHQNVQLPELKLKSVDVKQLFEALEQASSKQVLYEVGHQEGGGVRRATLNSGETRYGFRAIGPITPETVWYFYVTGGHYLQPNTVRFYQLAPYLMQYKIDDVTTAIQAGWKMLGETETPSLNFHEDTKLLIAVGQPKKLEMIDSVLGELTKALPPESRERIRTTAAPTKQ